MPRKVMSEETLREMHLEKGMSSLEIARELGKSASGVAAALRRYGIQRDIRSAAKNRWKHTQDADWERLSRCYNEGATLEEIAEDVGCALSVASSHLSRFTTIRPRGAEVKPNSRGRIEIDVEEAIRMNQAGSTLTEIADHMGVSVQIVSKRLRDTGYQVLVWKASRDKFANIQAKKRKVAKAIDAKRCTICGEERGVQLCHIQPRRKGGPLNSDNAVALCPNHHWYFDRGILTSEELDRLDPVLENAAFKGYEHPHYGTDSLGVFFRTKQAYKPKRVHEEAV